MLLTPLFTEEWSEDGIRQMPFVRDILGRGYPAPTVVRLPGERAWAAAAPEWAKGRRAEIIARIAECAGEGTKFAEPESPNEPQPTSDGAYAEASEEAEELVRRAPDDASFRERREHIRRKH